MASVVKYKKRLSFKVLEDTYSDAKYFKSTVYTDSPSSPCSLLLLLLQ